jgi:hypothetical protein
MSRQMDIFAIVDTIADDLIKDSKRVHTSVSWRNNKYAEMISAGVPENKVVTMLDRLIDQAQPIAEKRKPFVDEAAMLKNQKKSAARYNAGEIANPDYMPAQEFNPQAGPKVYTPSQSGQYSRTETLSPKGTVANMQGEFRPPALYDPEANIKAKRGMFNYMSGEEFAKTNASGKADPNRTNADTIKRTKVSDILRDLEAENVVGKEMAPFKYPQSDLPSGKPIPTPKAEAEIKIPVTEAAVPNQWGIFAPDRAAGKLVRGKSDSMDNLLDKVLKNSPVLKSASKHLPKLGLVAGVGMGGKEIYDSVQEGKDPIDAAGNVARDMATGALGWNVGSSVGAGIGGMASALVPIAAPALVGGGYLTGGLIGSIGSTELGKAAWDWATKKQPVEKNGEVSLGYTDEQIRIAKALLEEEDKLKEKKGDSKMKHEQVALPQYQDTGFVDYGKPRYKPEETQR